MFEKIVGLTENCRELFIFRVFLTTAIHSLVAGEIERLPMVTALATNTYWKFIFKKYPFIHLPVRVKATAIQD